MKAHYFNKQNSHKKVIPKIVVTTEIPNSNPSGVNQPSQRKPHYTEQQ
jgi:hypothetical protein